MAGLPKMKEVWRWVRDLFQQYVVLKKAGDQLKYFAKAESIEDAVVIVRKGDALMAFLKEKLRMP